MSYVEVVYVKAKKKNKQKIQPNLTHQSTKKFSLVNFFKLISLLFSHAVKTHIICRSSLCQGLKKKKNQPNIKIKNKMI